MYSVLKITETSSTKYIEFIWSVCINEKKTLALLKCAIASCYSFKDFFEIKLECLLKNSHGKCVCFVIVYMYRSIDTCILINDKKNRQPHAIMAAMLVSPYWV